IPVLAVLALLAVWGYRLAAHFNPASVAGVAAPLHYFMQSNFDFLFLGVVLFYAHLRLARRASGIAAFLAPSYYVLLFAPYVLAATLPGDLVQTFGLPIASVCFAAVVFIAAAAPSPVLVPTRGGRLLAQIGDRSYS